MQPAVPPDTPADSSWKLITLAVLLAAWGVIYWACQPGPPFAPPLKKLSSKQREALFAGRNQVLGQLDNALSDAQINPVLQKLDELEKILPGDRFISQNRAIAYVLALQVQDKAEVPKLAPDEVLAELEAIKQADPKSAVPWLLAAQVAEKNSQGERMLAEARKAVKLAPQEPLAWFAVAKAGEFLAGEPEVARETETALGKALEFDPTNTHILRLLAVVLATQQNPEVEQVLQTLRSQTALLDLVRRDAAAQNKDPQEIDRYFDQAQQAAQEKDWDRCTGLCTRIGNLIKSQGWVQSDRQRIDPDQLALRFVATDFSTKLAPAPASDSTLSPLQFAPAEGLPPLPDLPGVVDLQVADADDDGTLDLVLLTPTTLRVISPRDGNWITLFEHTGAGPWRRVLVADLDRDENKNARKEPVAGGATPPTDPRTCDTADVDFLLWGAGGLVVLRNELQDPPPARQVLVVAQSDEFNAQRDPRDVCLVDIDHDGDLDLVVALDKTVRFWRNRGNQTFEEVTDRSQIPAGSFSIASLTAGPWNHDCFIDVVATTADGNLGVFENLGHSAFRWVPLADAAQAAPAGDRVLLFDADGNADWDLATAGPQGIGLVKSRAPEVGLVEIASAQALSTSAATQLFAADLNNDSWFDLVAWSHTAVVTPLVFAGSPAGPVAKATPLTLPGLTAIQALATADLDRDGDLDLVAAGKEGVRLFFNTTPAIGHWLALRLRAQPDDKVARVNHLGIGSVVEVWMGDQVRRQIVSQQFTHFGLGEVTAPDLLRIVWTNCVPQAQLSPATDQVLCQVQVQTTSCPFLFTWTGERFEFLYDFLWGAPIGLQFAEGVLAPARPWEYLHIPGDRLQPRDGRLVLQMTEELQEATYLDQVELLAIDHPADVEVFSNEKVGPPDLAPFHVHTVRQRRAPVAARDPRGRDVLDEVALADGRYFRGFGSPPRTGRVESHFLELDLGDLGPAEQPKRVLLVLSGYIYPTPTSVSVGLAQDPANPPGQPPALWVPDAAGEWRAVRPFCGFPGGKNKTIVLDLSDAFLARDYRLRLVTNFEIYWDEAFFTLDEAPAEIRQTPVELARADLHHRGFSRRLTNPHNAPDSYLYDQVDPSTLWLPMQGAFTRYGDVRPLLTTEDDHLLVFGFGDELTLEFTPPLPPPAGWKRDYILHNVGWDKDCDPNVRQCATVAPMPFRNLANDPAGEDSAAYRDYLRTWQTRTLPRMEFWRRKPQSSP